VQGLVCRGGTRRLTRGRPTTEASQAVPKATIGTGCSRAGHPAVGVVTRSADRSRLRGGRRQRATRSARLHEQLPRARGDATMRPAARRCSGLVPLHKCSTARSGLAHCLRERSSTPARTRHCRTSSQAVATAAPGEDSCPRNAGTRRSAFAAAADLQLGSEVHAAYCQQADLGNERRASSSAPSAERRPVVTAGSARLRPHRMPSQLPGRDPPRVARGVGTRGSQHSSRWTPMPSMRSHACQGRPTGSRRAWGKLALFVDRHFSNRCLGSVDK